MSSMFKSRQPRIGFHHDLEKKIRSTHTNLYGDNSSLDNDTGSSVNDTNAGRRIKVKINDEIMNADDLGRGNSKNGGDSSHHSTIPGMLKKGNAF
jgi:hypothetical protein